VDQAAVRRIRRAATSHQARILRRRLVRYAVMVLCAVVMIGPFVWMLLASLKTDADVRSVPPTFIPDPFTGDNYFSAVPTIRKPLETLHRVGLDYIHIGQQATTLSGGEAQRVKLAKELAKRATGRTLYILDEPTTGLHFHDVAKLLEVLHELVASGNTVVVIEHNLEVIKTADWIIDLGPEGGDAGGEIVAAGTPEDIVKVKRSYTGEFLKPVLARGSRRGKKGQVAAE
jgi:ABC-type dipeptide/oligopeptide/nickel transport system ATPase component